MYAQLCKRLNEHAPNLEPPQSKITTFKRLLLSKCKDEFENRAAVSAAYEKRAGELTNDEEEARFVAKRKMLGNIKFIGELGKLEMLHDSILHRCCEQLLVGRRKQSINDQTEDIECLAHLMKTCGRILDSAKAKQLMDQYFERIKALIAHPDLPTRIKFLLQDVMELRNNHWKPRKLTAPDGPRTIQQVREDAARDGCIYLPQQDSPPEKQQPAASNKLEEVIFSKIRPKGMEDIFGAPGDFGGLKLGTGPGVIPGVDNEYGYGGSSSNGYHNDSFENNGYRGRGSGPSFEEKFRENNSGYNSNDRGDYKEPYKKRDSFESKYAERPDFGDRFTANRNKTHPSNRGRGGRGGGGGHHGGDMERRTSPQFDSRMNNDKGGVKDLPPRFNRMNMNNVDRSDPPPLRPSTNSMMLKPKTPWSLPKSAMARPDGINNVPRSDKMMMMSTNEPPVIIQKASNNAKKQQEKKNQGPTRDEVFGKVDSMLEKLFESEATNEAFTQWKEAEIPGKMVNNALIHLLKRVIKNNNESQRQLALDLVDQLFTGDYVSGVQIKESLVKLVSGLDSGNTETLTNVAMVASWSLLTDKVKMVEMAEITEGGASHPLFFTILQQMAAKDKTVTQASIKEIKLMDQLPQNTRTEEMLGEVLEQRQLSFLVPLLSIKADMARQLEADKSPSAFLTWINSTVPEQSRGQAGFISALLANIMKSVTKETTLKDNNASVEKEDTDKEKELIMDFKPVLAAFLSNNQDLQLAAVYALQVFCFSRQFPKGMLLRWFVALYEADIIDEHVFLRWKEDVNDSYPGKGKALFQVNQWLTWLEEAESEEEEDEE